MAWGLRDCSRSRREGRATLTPPQDSAAARDAADPLAIFRDRFVIGDPDVVYLDGNSLGRLPLATMAYLQQVVAEEWGEGLITSWQERWWLQADQLGDRIGEIVGAGPGYVVIADSTSVVLFKLAVAALRARPGRKKIVTDDLNFPTDNYVLQGAADLLGEGHQVIRIPSDDAIHGPVAAIEAALGEDTALLSLSHVTFKSGYLYDMSRLTRAAHAAGALVLWDVSHSVGVVPLHLIAADVDLAVGCTYKYLNGGPGAPAFLFVNPAAGDELGNPIPGWWGHRQPFAFDLDFTADSGVRRFLTGTMPILSLAAIEPALEIVLAAGVEAARDKSRALTTFFTECATAELLPLGFTIASPLDPDRRGSHISLQHADGWRITRALIETARIIPDFREPNNIRFGFAPLYTTFAEVATAVTRLRDLTAGGAHLQYEATRPVVT